MHLRIKMEIKKIVNKMIGSLVIPFLVGCPNESNLEKLAKAESEYKTFYLVQNARAIYGEPLPENVFENYGTIVFNESTNQEDVFLIGNYVIDDIAYKTDTLKTAPSWQRRVYTTQEVLDEKVINESTESKVWFEALQWNPLCRAEDLDENYLVDAVDVQVVINQAIGLELRL